MSTESKPKKQRKSKIPVDLVGEIPAVQNISVGTSSGATRHIIEPRQHQEVEVDRAHAVAAGAVVRVLVRRGQDGAKAKKAAESAGAVHVVVAPVPSDTVTTMPQQEVMADDPVQALREYAKRDAPPKGADVAALAAEVFDLGGAR